MQFGTKRIAIVAAVVVVAAAAAAGATDTHADRAADECAPR
jgi:hypothetical protein